MGGYLGALTTPELYQRVAEEKAAALPAEPTWEQRAEAMPSYGEVAERAVPESLAPVTRLAGDLATDPVTWAMAGQPALAGLGRVGEIASRVPLATGLAAVYGPEIYQGLQQTASQGVEALRGGDIGKSVAAAASFATQALMAGGLVHGAVGELQGFRPRPPVAPQPQPAPHEMPAMPAQGMPAAGLEPVAQPPVESAAAADMGGQSVQDLLARAQTVEGLPGAPPQAVSRASQPPPARVPMTPEMGARLRAAGMSEEQLQALRPPLGPPAPAEMPPMPPPVVAEPQVAAPAPVVPEPPPVMTRPAPPATAPKDIIDELFGENAQRYRAARDIAQDEGFNATMRNEAEDRVRDMESRLTTEQLNRLHPIPELEEAPPAPAAPKPAGPAPPPAVEAGPTGKAKVHRVFSYADDESVNAEVTSARTGKDYVIKSQLDAKGEPYVTVLDNKYDSVLDRAKLGRAQYRVQNRALAAEALGENGVHALMKAVTRESQDEADSILSKFFRDKHKPLTAEEMESSWSRQGSKPPPPLPEEAAVAAEPVVEPAPLPAPAPEPAPEPEPVPPPKPKRSKREPLSTLPADLEEQRARLEGVYTGVEGTPVEKATGHAEADKIIDELLPELAKMDRPQRTAWIDENYPSLYKDKKAKTPIEGATKAEAEERAALRNKLHKGVHGAAARLVQAPEPAAPPPPAAAEPEPAAATPPPTPEPEPEAEAVEPPAEPPMTLAEPQPEGRAIPLGRRGRPLRGLEGTRLGRTGYLASIPSAEDLPRGPLRNLVKEWQTREGYEAVGGLTPKEIVNLGKAGAAERGVSPEKFQEAEEIVAFQRGRGEVSRPKADVTPEQEARAARVPGFTPFEPGRAKPVTPEDYKLVMPKLSEEQAAVLRPQLTEQLETKVNNLIRKWSRGDDALADELHTVADTIVQKKAKTYDPTKGTLWTHIYQDLERDFKRYKEQRRVPRQTAFDDKGRPVDVADPKSFDDAEEQLHQVMLDTADKADERLPASYFKRASQVLAQLDHNTRGAATAAARGLSYKEWAAETGTKEGAAQKLFSQLPGQIRDVLDSFGVPAPEGVFQLGKLTIPSSEMNQLGRSAMRVVEPPQSAELEAITKDLTPEQRFAALQQLPDETKQKLLRTFQSFVFGNNAKGMRGWVQELLQPAGILPELSFDWSKPPGRQKVAEAVLREGFGVPKPARLFSEQAQQEFTEWVNEQARGGREAAVDPAWKPAERWAREGLLKTSTPQGMMLATVRPLETGQVVYKPSARMWQGKYGPTPEEASGVYRRLQSLIADARIKPGDFVLLPEEIRDAPGWDSFQKKWLSPNEFGQEGLFKVKAAGRHAGTSTANFLGLQTMAELAKENIPRLADAARHGIDLFVTGVRRFPEWAAGMLREFGSGLKDKLGRLWLAVVDSGEKWAEAQSPRTKQFLTEMFRTEPSALIERGRTPIQQQELKAEIERQSDRVPVLEQAMKATGLDIPDDHLFKATTAKGIEEELALIGSRPAPAIDVSKVKPDSPYGELYRRGVNLSRTGLSEEAKTELADVAKVVDLVSRSDAPLRFKEVVRQAIPIMDKPLPEIIEQLQKKGIGRLSYGEAFALRSIRDGLVQPYMDAKQAFMQTAADVAAGKPGAVEAAAKAKAANATALLNLAATTDLARQQGQHAGRLLAFQKILTDPKLASQLSFEERFTRAAQESLRLSRGEAEQLAAAYGEVAAGTKELPAFMEFLHTLTAPTLKQQAMEAWKSGLFGPASIMAKAASDTLYTALSQSENWMAGHLAPVWKPFLGKMAPGLAEKIGEAALHPLPLDLRTHAMLEAGSEALARLRTDLPDLLTAQPLDPGYGRAGSFEELRVHGGAIPGRLGEFIRSMPKAAELTTEIAKNNTRIPAMHEAAWNLMMKETGGVADRARYQELLGELRESRNLNDLLDKYPTKEAEKLWTKYKPVWSDIEKQASQVTYSTPLQEQPYFKTLAGMMRYMQQASQRSAIVGTIFPFVKTPVNIAIEGMMHTPMGFWQVAKAIESGDITAAKFQRDIVKPILGTSIMGAVTALGMGGIITGSGPSDPKQRDVLQRTGWQPYSIKLGDNYYSYQRMEPVASLLGLGADFGEGIGRGDFMTKEGQLSLGKVGAKLVDSISENLASKTPLTGLENIFAVISDPERNSERFIKGLTASVVPNSLGYVPFGSLARAMDPVVRQTGILTAPMAKIPFYSEQLPAQVNPLGEQRERPGSFLEVLASPIRRSEVRSDKAAQVAEELDRIGYTPAKPNTYANIGNRKVFYTQQELEKLDESTQRANDEVYRVIKAASYQNAPDSDADPRAAHMKTKQQILEGVYRKYRNQVQERLTSTLTTRAHHNQLGEAAR